MKNLVIAVLIGASICAFAKDKNDNYVPFNQLPPEVQKERIAQAQEHRLKRMGGDIEKPGSCKGVILFVNSQTEVATEELQKGIDEIVKRLKLDIRLVSNSTQVTVANAGVKKRELGADIAVFITQEAEGDTMLLNAPEAGWAIVNAKAVFKEAKNDVFKAARLRKEILRAFYSVAGAMNSQYPNSLMKGIRTAKELDRLSDNVPMDVYARTKENLASFGITPLQIVPYRRACEQGWAPAPTNEVQQAIWDKVHAVPKNPIKIEFDPAKGK